MKTPNGSCTWHYIIWTFPQLSCLLSSSTYNLFLYMCNKTRAKTVSVTIHPHESTCVDITRSFFIVHNPSGNWFAIIFIIVSLLLSLAAWVLAPKISISFHREFSACIVSDPIRLVPPYTKFLILAFFAYHPLVSSLFNICPSSALWRVNRTLRINIAVSPATVVYFAWDGSCKAQVTVDSVTVVLPQDIMYLQ